MASEILTTQQLGERWHIATETLRYWRWNGTGPVFVKFNGCILYRLDDIDQFERAHLRRHTADGLVINGVEGKVEE